MCINKNEKYWRDMDEAQLNDYVDEIFKYYRNHGFPYYPTDSNSRDADFRKLLNYDRSNLIVDGVVKQTMHGLGLAWSYFPHSFKVRSGKFKSPYDAFIDDDIFLKIIRKRLNIGTFISDAGIRKMLKIYSGVQGVSNFRPTAAAAIYDRFAQNGVVWDMSSGWGGRLLGAIISNINTYIGTEPSTLTYEGLNKLKNDYGGNMNIIINKIGSEDFVPERNSLDLCFTSPPYFNLEKYSNEITQSYMKYPTLSEWFEGFIYKTFLNCYYGLKPNKYMLINIADIKDYSIESNIIKIAKEIGFEYENTMKLALSNVNMKTKNNNKFKYEPIFVFKKIK